MELYKKYRPKKLSSMVGNEQVCNMFLRMLKTKSVPHAILLHGPSGCGKTTIARILRRALRCVDQDFREVNCADFRGIDMVREIRVRMVGMCSPGGEARVWLIDEAHQLSTQAQNAFLKIMEDTPPRVYFILATTDPQKLLSTIRTRCTEAAVRGLTVAETRDLLQRTAEAENLTLSDTVRDRIVDTCNGSPRKALVLLDSIRDIEDEAEQLALVAPSTSERQAIELARLLIKPKVKWAEVAKAIKEINEDPEQLRWMVLGYANSIVLGGGKLSWKAAQILDAFQDNFYDSKKAGLTLACWEVVEGLRNV